MQIPASSHMFQEGLPDDSEDGNARLLPAVATLREHCWGLSCEHGGNTTVEEFKAKLCGSGSTQRHLEILRSM